MVGITVTRQQIDAAAGNVLSTLGGTFLRIKDLDYFLQSITDADLTAMGYSVDDIYKLRVSVQDAAQIGRVFAGQEGVAQPKDFRTYIKLFWGMLGVS